ncbi:MAG: hypothetical protein FJY73_09215 [Candidatus Eisenbacteria bacterium]|nr:hypothetical protein [Candidatus Eisenbacteria bacterium]
MQGPIDFRSEFLSRGKRLTAVAEFLRSLRPWDPDGPDEPSREEPEEEARGDS